jgi:hypothetical protein
MSAMGLGRVKTLYGMERNDLSAVAMRVFAGLGYALIAAMSGWMPMMFITRVRL